MAPPCTGMKGISALSRLMAPDAWRRSRMVSAPLGQLAGEIAPHQLKHERHFLVLPSWEQVQQHPRVVWTCVLLVSVTSRPKCA
eukprot:1691491-Prorocentrum_lima.AAC.1